MKHKRMRLSALVLALVMILGMTGGAYADVLNLSTQDSTSSYEQYYNDSYQEYNATTQEIIEDNYPPFLNERPVVVEDEVEEEEEIHDELDKLEEEGNTPPQSKDDSASAIVVEQMENKIKAVARKIEEFKVPLNDIYKEIRDIKLEIMSLGGNISPGSIQSLNDRVELIEKYASDRDVLELVMFTEPPTKTSGNKLKTLATDLTVLTGIREAAEEYLNIDFPKHYLAKAINDNRRYNPGQLSLVVIREAHEDLRGWIDSPAALVELTKLVEALELADVEYVNNGGDGVVDPEDPTKPGDGEDNLPEEGDLDTVTKEDLKVFNEFKESIAVEFKGAPMVTTKELSENYIARVAVREAGTNRELADETTRGGEIALKDISTATSVVVGFEVYKTSGTTVGASIGKDVLTLEINDTTKPKLNYAYVIDGALILNITDDSGLADVNPILYRIEGEDNFKALDSNFGYGTNYGRQDKNDVFDDLDDLFGKNKFDRYRRLDKNDYRIEVPVPTSVQVVAVDKFGNKLPIVVEIESDNTKITNTVPEYITKFLESVGTNSFNNKKYEDLIAVNSGTTVDILETFKKLILSEFRRFNSYDLIFSNQDGELLSSGKIKFEEVGLHRITISHRSEVGGVEVFVSVNDGISNVKAYTVKPEVEINNKSFKPIEALVAQSVGASKLNPGQLMALVDGDYTRMDQEVSFGSKTEKDVTIIDLNTGKEYGVKFKMGSGGLDDLFPDGTPPTPPVINQSPTDIRGHWANSYITNMINKGYISGYPDGTFGPNNMITVRETLAVVGRVVAANPSNAGQIYNQNTVTGWGKAEVEASLQRLPSDIFGGNYDRAITRGETAYVIANSLRFQGNPTGKIVTDVYTSPYSNEINTLVNQGVISGFPDGTYRPNLEITRAEVATILSKAPLR